MFRGFEVCGVRRLIPFTWQGATITMHKRQLKKDGHLCATKRFKQFDSCEVEGGTKLYQLCIPKQSTLIHIMHSKTALASQKLNRESVHSLSIRVDYL